MTKHKSFNVRQNMSQRKIRYYTQIRVILKPLLLHVHLRVEAMALQQLCMYLCTDSICEKCVYNMSK